MTAGTTHAAASAAPAASF